MRASLIDAQNWMQFTKRDATALSPTYFFQWIQIIHTTMHPLAGNG
jgi:hypothetical protein